MNVNDNIERFNEVRYHVHGAACGPHRETGLGAATRRYLRLLLADPAKVAAPWVTRATGEALTDEEAAHLERARESDEAKTVAADALHDAVGAVASVAREVGDDAEPFGSAILGREASYLVPAESMLALREALAEWTRMSEAAVRVFTTGRV